MEVKKKVEVGACQQQVSVGKQEGGGLTRREGIRKECCLEDIISSLTVPWNVPRVKAINRILLFTM